MCTHIQSTHKEKVILNSIWLTDKSRLIYQPDARKNACSHISILLLMAEVILASYISLTALLKRAIFTIQLNCLHVILDTYIVRAPSMSFYLLILLGTLVISTVWPISGADKITI